MVESGYAKFIDGGNRLLHTTLFMYFLIVILKTILWGKFSLNIFTKFHSIPETFQNSITTRFLFKNYDFNGQTTMPRMILGEWFLYSNPSTIMNLISFYV